MIRTTVAIEEDLLAAVKRRAADEGVPMHHVVNRLLRQALVPAETGEYRLRLRTWRAELQPGVDLLDRDALFDLMDGRGGRW